MNYTSEMSGDSPSPHAAGLYCEMFQFHYVKSYLANMVNSVLEKPKIT